MMDATGWREWDCSRLLGSLLTSHEGKAVVLGEREVRRPLELGAGTGSLALQLASSHAFSTQLEMFTATDVEGRVGQIGTRVREHGLEAKVRVASLNWGEAPDGCYDLILGSELLYWPGGDIFEDDSLMPLASTIASALSTRNEAVCLLAFRSRHPLREEGFSEMCRSRGVCVERCEQELVNAHAPATPEDPEEAPFVLLRLYMPLEVPPKPNPASLHQISQEQDVNLSQDPCNSGGQVEGDVVSCFLTASAADLVNKIGKQLRALGAMSVDPRFEEHKVFFKARLQVRRP